MDLVSILTGSRWLLALVALVLYATHKVRTYNRLKAFKGPPSSGWFSLWHSYTLLGDKEHLAYKQVCDKYGTLAQPSVASLLVLTKPIW